MSTLTGVDLRGREYPAASLIMQRACYCVLVGIEAVVTCCGWTATDAVARDGVHRSRVHLALELETAALVLRLMAPFLAVVRPQYWRLRPGWWNWHVVVGTLYGKSS
mmetsp:Transcript_121137/g.235782  ORF Transcript_121137/g.235782 Transcript_121137/m.235782 type:complete len:107 (-) Transcript_121137:87-407(-)